MLRPQPWVRIALGFALLLLSVGLPGCGPEQNPYSAGEPQGSREMTWLRFTVETDLAHANWAEAFAAQLVPLGVRVTVRVSEWGEVIQRAGAGESDACLVGWSGSGADPLGLPVSKLASSGAENFSGYASREFDLLLAGCLIRPDEGERQDLTRKAQAFLQEEVPWIFGVHVPLYDASTVALTGWVSGPAGAVSLRDAVLTTGDKRVTVGLGLGRRPSLDPLGPIDPQAAIVLRSLFDSLVSVGADGNLLPELASSWEWSHNARRLVVGLKEGVFFHNGDPLTAADVVFTYEAVLPGRLPHGLTAEVRAEGALDLVFTFSGPLPQFLDYLGLQPIVPASYYLKLGPEGFSTSPVGAGPFRMDPDSATRHLILVRWGDYHGRPDCSSGVPAPPDEVFFSLIPDPDRRVSMLQEGQIALAPSLTPEAISRLRGTDGVTFVRQPGVTAVFVELNNRRPPFGDTRVRLALNLALDRSALAAALGPETSLLSNAFLPGAGDLQPQAGFQLDTELAKRLLTESGYMVAEP